MVIINIFRFCFVAGNISVIKLNCPFTGSTDIQLFARLWQHGIYMVTIILIHLLVPSLINIIIVTGILQFLVPSNVIVVLFFIILHLLLWFCEHTSSIAFLCPFSVGDSCSCTC